MFIFAMFLSCFFYIDLIVIKGGAMLLGGGVGKVQLVGDVFKKHL